MDVRRHVTAGPAVGAVRRGHPRDRQVRPHPGLAAGRRAGAAAAGARDPRRAGGVRRRASTPTSTTAARREIAVRVHRARARRPRLPPRAVDPGRLAGLAQGDGVGPAAATSTRRSSGRWRSVDHTPEQVAELFPPYPYEAHAPIVGGGARRRRRLRAGRRRAAAPATPSGRRSPPTSAAQLRRAAPDRSTRLPVARRTRRRDRQQLLGRRRRALRDRRAAARQRPAPRRQPAGHLDADGPALPRRSAADCPLDVAGFTFSGVPGVIIGHNADIAWGFTNLGPDVTDLYLEQVDGDDRGSRTAGCGRCDPRPRRSRCAAGRRRRSRCARPRTARCSATSRRTSRRSAPTRPAAAGPDAAATGTPSRWRGPRSTPTHDRRRDPRRSTPRTDWTSFREAAVDVRRARAEPRVRRPRRPHRLPGARPDPDPQVRQRRPACRQAGWLQRERLDRRLRAVRRAAQRARPRRGVRRHRQPGGDRAGLPLLPHRRLGPRLPLAADPRPARATSRADAVGRRHGRAPARRPATRSRRRWCRYLLDVDLPRGYYSARPATAARTGTSTSPPTARPPTYFNVGLAQRCST